MQALRERMERSMNSSPVSGILPLGPPLSNSVVTMPTSSSSNHSNAQTVTVAKDANPPTSTPPVTESSTTNSALATTSSLLTDTSSDLLHNLLGVDNSAIDQMINAGSADDAAKLLGMN